MKLEFWGTNTPTPLPIFIVPSWLILEPEVPLLPAYSPIVLSPFWVIVVLIVPLYPSLVNTPTP